MRLHVHWTTVPSSAWTMVKIKKRLTFVKYFTQFNLLVGTFTNSIEKKKKGKRKIDIVTHPNELDIEKCFSFFLGRIVHKLLTFLCRCVSIRFFRRFKFILFRLFLNGARSICGKHIGSFFLYFVGKSAFLACAAYFVVPSIVGFLCRWCSMSAPSMFFSYTIHPT